MHDQLKTLKPLLKAGEYEKATDILKEYRAEFPDDWDGKLMAGFIAQLRGDEKTFRRIHDEAQDFIRKAAAIQSSSLWEKYRRLIQKANDEKTEVPMEKEETTDIDNETTDWKKEPGVLYGSPEYMDSRIEKKQRKQVQYSSLSFRKSISSNEELEEPTQVLDEPYEGDLYAAPEYMDSRIEEKKKASGRKTNASYKTKHDSDKTIFSKGDDEPTINIPDDDIYRVAGDDIGSCPGMMPPSEDDEEESSDQPGPLYRACQYLARFFWKLSGKFQS